MNIDIHRQNGCRVPTRPMLKQLPHITSEATRERKQTATALKSVGKFLGCDAMGCKPREGTRIDIAWARCHHKSFGRGETHGGIDRAATCSGGHGGSAA